MPDDEDDWGPIAQLLREAHLGNQTAMDQLFSLVYAELRRLADACLRRERPDHTLQRTALVHEAYLRLRRQSLPQLQDRAHFMKLATRVMRQILVDHARRRNVGKRSAAMHAPIEAAVAVSSERPQWMIHLDDALSELEKRDERKARLIEMRFFSGLTAEESASVLNMETRDVRRELRLAQAWLARELDRGATQDV
jgi:RNA polymerase sigma factor (TIGR02999 family)